MSSYFIAPQSAVTSNNASTLHSPRLSRPQLWEGSSDNKGNSYSAGGSSSYHNNASRTPTKNNTNTSSGNANQWFCEPASSSSSAMNNFAYIRQHSRSPRAGTPTRTFGTVHRNASPATPVRRDIQQQQSSHRPSSPSASTRGGTQRASTPTAGSRQVPRAHTPTRASAAKIADVPVRHYTPGRTTTTNSQQQQQQQGGSTVSSGSPYLARLYERQLSSSRAIGGGSSQQPSLSPSLLSSGSSQPYVGSGKPRASTPSKSARSVDSYGSMGGMTSSTTNGSQQSGRATPPPNRQSTMTSSSASNRPSLHPSSVLAPGSYTPSKASASGSTTPTPSGTPNHQMSSSNQYYDPFGTGPNSPTTPVMPRPQLNRREATPHTPTTPRLRYGDDSTANSSFANSPIPSSGSFVYGVGDVNGGGSNATSPTPTFAPGTPTAATSQASTPTKPNFGAVGSKQLFNQQDSSAITTGASSSSQQLSSVPARRTHTPTSSHAVSMAGGVPTPSSWGTGPKATLRAFVNCWINKYKENSKNYREGGYCTVAKGDVLNKRYTLLSKLGWGEFSVVWLARDSTPAKAHHTFVAVKIAKCHPSVVNGTKYEINLLRYITDSPKCLGPMTELLDHFEHTGAYGLHMCMVMPVMGSNLLCVIDQMKARRRLRKEKELSMIKDLTYSTLAGLDALEAINVVHTDIKPENVLVAAPDPKMVNLVASCVGPEEEALVQTFAEGDPAHPTAAIADFGLSFLLEHPSYLPPGAERVGVKKDLDVQYPGIANNKKGILIQTREYRAPEVLFGSTINCRSDVWSVGCMVFELITGDFLMDPKKKTSNEREMDIEHLAMMMHILGPVPQHISRSSQNPAKHLGRYFDAEGRFLHQEKLKGTPRRSIATELEVFLEPAEAERAAQFIMSCFTYDPLERCHARDLLNHSWLKSVLSRNSAAAAAANGSNGTNTEQ